MADNQNYSSTNATERLLDRITLENWIAKNGDSATRFPGGSSWQTWIACRTALALLDVAEAASAVRSFICTKCTHSRKANDGERQAMCDNCTYMMIPLNDRAEVNQALIRLDAVIPQVCSEDEL